MRRHSQKGGAVLITTILILLIGAVISLTLLTSSRIGSRISGNYKLQENAFNVAEMGFEAVRPLLTNFNNLTGRLFSNAADKKGLFDPNFNDYSDLIGNSGAYGSYYGLYPEFKGTTTINLPDGKTMTGEWYVRIVDNDLIVNEPLSGDYIQNGYLNTDKVKAALAITDPDLQKQALKGIVLNCAEVHSDKNGVPAGDCKDLPTLDFSDNVDHVMFLESRGIIRKGNDIEASRLVRIIIRNDSMGGGGRNPSQKGGAPGGTRANVAPGVTPTGYVVP